MSLRRNSIEPEGGRGSEDIYLFLFGKHLRFSFNAVDLCLTQEVVGSDSVVVPNLQRQNSRLSKLRLLQREKGLLLLIHHLFLQDGWKTFIYTKQTDQNKGQEVTITIRFMWKPSAGSGVYLSGKVVEAEHKSPVEVSFSSQRVEVDVSLLFLSFQPLYPAAESRND